MHRSGFVVCRLRSCRCSAGEREREREKNDVNGHTPSACCVRTRDTRERQRERDTDLHDPRRKSKRYIHRLYLSSLKSESESEREKKKIVDRTRPKYNMQKRKSKKKNAVHISEILHLRIIYINVSDWICKRVLFLSFSPHAFTWTLNAALFSNISCIGL